MKLWMKLVLVLTVVVGIFGLSAESIMNEPEPDIPRAIDYSAGPIDWKSLTPDEQRHNAYGPSDIE